MPIALPGGTLRPPAMSLQPPLSWASVSSCIQVYPIIFMSFLRSCCQVFLGLSLVSWSCELHGGGRGGGDCLVRYIQNKVSELIQRLAWYLTMYLMDFYNGLLHLLVLFYSGPSRNWKIICGCGLSSTSFVHECTTESWTHSGKIWTCCV